MGIFKRLSDIISANLNELIENAEDPELMLKQAVREMESAIANAKPEVARAMANERSLAKEIAANEGQVETWTKRAETAVQSGDDDLARKALNRKRDYEKILAALRDQHEAASEACKTLRHQLEAMQAKLKDAQRRLGTLTARKRAADARARMAAAQSCFHPRVDTGAFDKFDRLTRKVEMAEAEAEALSELARRERTVEDTMFPGDNERGDLEIEAELEELKRKQAIQ